MSNDPRQPIAPEGAAQDQPRCGLCGQTVNLTRTPCCSNWICDDENQYVPFSYERNSCFRNHMMFTVCGFHHHQGHEGRWQDCAKCREDGPLELYVHHATNEYNFEKLSNPPPFEPTHCHRCSVRVRLAHDSYSMDRDGVLCMACGEARNPGQREGLSRALGRQHGPAQRSEADYPIGTLAYYGPTNRLATKIAAAIVKRPGADPDPLHRWITHAGDIRDDRAIAHQVAAFFRRHRVKEVASSRRVIGCPHEEGKDYPAGGKCPHCPFWHDRDRFTLDPLPEGGMSVSEIVAELSDAKPKRQPIEALAAAECHRQELVEPLLRAIERGLADPDSTPPGEAMLFSYALYLLAKWREARAYPLFIRWLSLPGEGAFDIGGDTVTQDGKRLLASVCGGDLEPIKRLILNREANEFCRGQAIEAMALLASRQEVPYREVTEYFNWLAHEGLERVHSHVWDNLAASCADTEALDAFPELRRAYAEGLIDAGFMNADELDEVEQCPRGRRLAHSRERHPPIDDVATETAWWQCFRNDPFQAMAREASTERERSLLKPRPYRASPKVGRNDPCPCGSGKKFKNCCGK